MKNTLKIIGLFVLLTTSSFIYGQDEVDETKGKDVKSMGVDTEVKSKVIAKQPCCTTDKPKQEKMASHETGKKAVDKTEAVKSQKGSFWKRIFGDKSKKEEDPN
jgi:hypothetical protein